MSQPNLTFRDLQVGDIFEDVFENIWRKIEVEYIQMGTKQIPRNAQALRSNMAGVQVNRKALFSDSTPIKLKSNVQLSSNIPTD